MLPIVICSCSSDDDGISIENDFDYGITLRTQEQVNTFGANNYTTVQGRLIIGDRFASNTSEENISDIVDLTPLSTITQITGQLLIVENPILESLNGLENLNTIGTGLSIGKNDNLNSLNGLEGLTDVNAEGIDPNVGRLGLTIQFNPNLTSLSGLINVQNCADLYIRANSSLSSLSGLEGLTSLNGVLRISENNALISFEGLGNIESVQSLSIAFNTSLTSLTGLEGLQTITNDIEIFQTAIGSLEALFNLEPQSINRIVIFDNDNLPSLNGLQSITGVSSYMEIEDNNGLLTLDGLENLEDINTLLIASNPLLSSLDAFENLTSEPVNTIRIRNNQSLLSIEGLASVVNIEEVLDISFNNNLTSLQGLENIQTAKAIDMTSNPQLQSISALQNIQSSAIIRIQDNASLTSLEGLENITEVGQALIINSNPQITSLDNLSSLNRVTEINIFDGFFIGLFIENNGNLNNLCSLQTALENNSPLNTSIYGNSFNPSIQDVLDGNCSQ